MENQTNQPEKNLFLNGLSIGIIIGALILYGVTQFLIPTFNNCDKNEHSEIESRLIEFKKSFEKYKAKEINQKNHYPMSAELALKENIGRLEECLVLKHEADVIIEITKIHEKRYGCKILKTE